jgi:raffinose/stachyose/melibiose transport system permease protein
MSTTVASPVTAPPRSSSARRRRVKGGRNYLGGLFGWVWLAIIIIPIYYMVVTSFKDQGAYFTQNPLALPNPPTLTAYQQVVEAGIIRYFFNSVIVTIGAVVPLVLFSFLASYAIVRGESRLLRFSRTLFLLGLPSRCRRRSSPLSDHHQDPHVRLIGGADLPSIAFGIRSRC